MTTPAGTKVGPALPELAAADTPAPPTPPPAAFDDEEPTGATAAVAPAAGAPIPVDGNIIGDGPPVAAAGAAGATECMPLAAGAEAAGGMPETAWGPATPDGALAAAGGATGVFEIGVIPDPAALERPFAKADPGLKLLALDALEAGLVAAPDRPLVMLLAGFCPRPIIDDSGLDPIPDPRPLPPLPSPPPPVDGIPPPPSGEIGVRAAGAEPATDPPGDSWR
ncbi:hypothetical protein P5V93_23375 [Mycobacteroides abscessus subsp. abscessus]|uniref:hypothetical protein n=1 Tax=Mycobacteroides abscessus TaxID=36809 RepID=UPI001042813A|nr:hypothetical protein [Mycobacteroides abscessus]MDO3194351.1 hypothetical protein [Mycobacteroides abscessus subsp. abscessus]MDO3287454.1 hypothetical protein [Mycobacteroides abscessus subsp. abscessus]